MRITLPTADGGLQAYELDSAPPHVPEPAAPASSRIGLAAVHVVVDPLRDADPVHESGLDWDATLAYRHHLWDMGLGVAEAMDTAQRGMGLTPAMAAELVRRSIAEARSVGGRLYCGVATDALPSGTPATVADVIAEYERGVESVEAEGGQVVLMASRQLAAAARSADDYEQVYGRLLEQVGAPVIIHWLGDMFDPALAGYWGSADRDEAAKVVVRIVQAHPDKVDGVKYSMLDADREIHLRRQMPQGVRLYTGDDFAFPGLIKGDDHGYSDALLGAFDAIAPVAAKALRALDRGDTETYDRLLAPTVPLSRHIFEAPTFHYKVGVVFLAYLNGHQRHFRMVGGLESARSVVHLSRLFVLADRAGLLIDRERAARRMRRVLALAGIDEAP